MRIPELRQNHTTGWRQGDQRRDIWDTGSTGLDNDRGGVKKKEKWRKTPRMHPNPSLLPGGWLEDREHPGKD